MSRELFGTDGVRGLAGQYPLDSEGTQRVGLAVATYFAKPGQQIVIGCDTRESSAQIVKDLTIGLNKGGVNVVSAGVLPTPGLAYLTGTNEQFVAGVMVTASHNTYEYNGIKVFDGKGGKLSDSVEAELNALIEKDVSGEGTGNYSEDDKLIQQYENFLIGTADGLDLGGLKIAVDSANGAASGIAERVFSRLGADVSPLFDKPDGKNINAGCGATDIKALSHVVTEQKLALGIALDGDADRLIMVDEAGRDVKGDYLLYLLAVVRQAEGVVATVMSNKGFELALKSKGIKLLRTDVGDRYVLEGLRQTGYKLGGEASGHIIFPLVLSTGDGLLAAVQTLRAINSSGKSLAQWCNEVNLLPQALVNIPLSDKQLLERPDVADFINSQNEKLGDGRLLIRPSGTEPLARVMVEAPDAEKIAEAIASDLQELLERKESGMNEFPVKFANYTLPLGELALKPADAELLDQLAAKGYEVHLGLTPDYSDAISQMCLQASIKEYCPNDSTKRFADRAAAEKWLTKGRAAFLLLKKEDDRLTLAGYGWAGRETSDRVPGGETTFAIRIGEGNQGQGLSTPFLRLIVAATAATYGAKNIWLETWGSDGAAVHIYHKLGCVDVEQVPSKRPTADGSEVDDTRVYMSLPNEKL